MRQTIRLLLVTCVALVAVGGLDAAVAEAAGPVPVTGPATSITSNAATLTGAIVPNGNALEYEFQYGTTTQYGKNTTPVTLGPNTALEAVSAGVQGLSAHTTYHFRLVVLAIGVRQANGTYYYYNLSSTGLDKTFRTTGTTSKGKLTLRSTKLHVRRGVASASIGCSSVFRCKGKLTLTKRIKVGKRHKTIRLGSKSFSIRAGKHGTVRIKLSKQAKTILRFARHHRTKATLSAKAFTGQRGFRRTVTLQG